VAGHPVWPRGGRTTPRPAVWGQPNHPQWPKGWFGCPLAYISASKPYRWTSRVFPDITKTSNPSTLDLIRFFTSTDDSISSVDQNPNLVPDSVTTFNALQFLRWVERAKLVHHNRGTHLKMTLSTLGPLNHPQTSRPGGGQTTPGQTGWPATTYGVVQPPQHIFIYFFGFFFFLLDFFFFKVMGAFWE
jgi:hypothetical protein